MKQPKLEQALEISTNRRQPPPATAPAKAKEQAKSRQGKSQIAGFFDPEISRTLRMIAIEQSTTIQSLLEESLKTTFAKYGKEWVD